MGPLYSSSLLDGAPLHAVYPDGRRVPVPVDDWRGPMLPGDCSVVARCTGPTLDVGCGPGRFGAALANHRVPCLGIDIDPAAVRLAQATAAAALCASVFDPLPAEGTWSTVLLVDGNVGIGGSPCRLLTRTAELLEPDGQLLVELAPPGAVSGCHLVRLTRGRGLGRPFPWARLAAQDIRGVARRSGLSVHETWEEAGRWFARLGSG